MTRVVLKWSIAVVVIIAAFGVATWLSGAFVLRMHDGAVRWGIASGLGVAVGALAALWGYSYASPERHENIADQPTSPTQAHAASRPAAARDGAAQARGISIRITRRYMGNVEFSVVSTGGLYEVQELYVEVKAIRRCEPAPPFIGALAIRTNYSITLVPFIKTYPLLPPRVQSGDNWVLKQKDADLFAVHFSWPALSVVDVIIKADVIDHETGDRETVASTTVKLWRGKRTCHHWTLSHHPRHGATAVLPLPLQAHDYRRFR